MTSAASAPTLALWGPVAGLTLAVVLLLIWPWLSARRPGDARRARRRAVLVGAWQTRRAEMQADAASGRLPLDLLPGLLAELDRRLLAESEGLPSPSAPSDPAGGDATGAKTDTGPSATRAWTRRATALALALGLIVAPALWWFVQTRQPEAFEAVGTFRIENAPPTELAELSAKLAEKLADDPRDAQGWMLMARLRFEMNQPAASARAWARANRLTRAAPRAEWLADEAEARALGAGSLVGEPQALLGRALALNPNLPKALFLSALAARNEGRADAARDFFARLDKVPGLGDELKRAVAEQLADLGPAAPAGGVRLAVTVTLAPALAARRGPNDALFVFARADGPGAPPMPLAAVRLPAPVTLPATVELSDATAMMGGVNLSAFPKYRIGARLVPPGREGPLAAPGDVQGETRVARPSAAPDATGPTPPAAVAVTLDGLAP